MQIKEIVACWKNLNQLNSVNTYQRSRPRPYVPFRQHKEQKAYNCRLHLVAFKRRVLSSAKTSLPVLLSAADQSINRLIDLSICRSIDQSINRSVDLSINRSIDLSICRSVDQSINRSVDLSVNQWGCRQSAEYQFNCMDDDSNISFFAVLRLPTDCSVIVHNIASVVVDNAHGLFKDKLNVIMTNSHASSIETHVTRMRHADKVYFYGIVAFQLFFALTAYIVLISR